MKNLNILRSMRWNQYLCRPAGARRPADEESAFSAQFPLSPTELVSVNRRLRAVMENAIPPEQRERVEEIDGLVKDILGLRVNVFRALISQLTMDERNTDCEVYYGFKNETLRKMPQRTLAATWNDLLTNVFYLIESSMYQITPEVKEMAAGFLEPLQLCAKEMPVQAFPDQNSYDQFMRRFALLNSSLGDWDHAFPFLLDPASPETSPELTARNIEIYRTLLTFIKGTIQRYHKECASAFKGFKNPPLRHQFFEGLNAMQKHVQILQRDLENLMPLWEKARQGNQEAIGSLSKLMEKFTGTDIMQNLHQQLIPHMRALEAVKRTHSGVESIVDRYNLTMRHAMELWIRMSDALFNGPFNRINRCHDFVEGLKPILNVRSAHVTPLDLYRSWWAAPYIAPAKTDERIAIALGCIETIMQTLQSPGLNIYERDLSHLPELAAKLRANMPAGFSHEPLKLLEVVLQKPFPELLQAWLNTPLLQSEHKGDPQPVYLRLLAEVEQYLRTYEPQMIVIGGGAAADEPVVPMKTHTIAMVEALKEEIQLLRSHPKMEGEPFKQFCRSIVPLFKPLSSAIIKGMMSPETPQQLKEVLLQDLFMYEDLRTLYLRPFLAMGKEFGWTAQVKEKQPIPSRPKSPSGVLRTEIQKIQGLKNPVKTALQDLVDALNRPFSLEAIYRAAARCIQLHSGRPELDSWKERMLENLQIGFAPRAMESYPFHEDMMQTFTYLGISEKDVHLKEPSTPVVGETEEIDTLGSALFAAKFDFPLRSCQGVEGESVILKKWRDAMVYEILDAMVSDLDAVDLTLRKAVKSTLSPVHLRFLILKTAQLLEGALTVNLLRSSTPVAAIEECMKDHNLLNLSQLQLNRLFTPEQLELIDAIQDYASWIDDPRDVAGQVPELLRQAEQLFRGSPEDREALRDQQKDLLAPRILQLIQLTTGLLTPDAVK